MAGFAYQAEVAISRAVQCLSAANCFEQAGQVFVEALSDMAQTDSHGNVLLLQVKRTLTAATLESAAAEIAAIEGVDAGQTTPLKPNYGVVCQHHDIELSWAKLPSSSAHQALIQILKAQNRLTAPRCEPNPRWQALGMLWNTQEKPFEFYRFAFDRILRRTVESGDAQACWEDIAERYRQGQPKTLSTGQFLSLADVVLGDRNAQSGRLEVGQQVTWDRWRRGQYMARPQLAVQAMAQALALHEEAIKGLSYQLDVLWLSGRSGAGKSVLLLNTVSELVQRGHSVLWLKPSQLQTALERMANADAGHTPDFLAIDDLYDPDARDRLDLAHIASLLDESGARTWPVLLTCGPTEFAKDFEAQSGYRGFGLHLYEISLLNQAETQQLHAWAGRPLNTDAQSSEIWSGEATQQTLQGQGLFVSVALELEQGDMRQFGQRFANRVKQYGQDFTQHLCLCLAVNRLYMQAPATWLSDEDRVLLQDFNQNQDFALQKISAGQEWLRLTHPHLSNAIYPHLLPAQVPRQYADDLGQAFEKALRTHGPLAQRLLQTFSAGGNAERHERMQAVDADRLAQLCVKSWHSCPPGGDVRVQAGMRVSWACWPAAHDYLKQSTEALIQAALDEMLAAETQFKGLGWWLAWWLRLWRARPQHPLLIDWAIARLTSSAAQPEPQWSFIWEAVWVHAQKAQRQALRNSATQWLQTQGLRSDWHFVWRHLREDAGLITSELSALLPHALTDISRAHWLHVWGEAMQAPPQGWDAQRLLALGCQWLEGKGREDKDQWKFVWEALLQHKTGLPSDWDEKRLLALGCQWLEGKGREDKEQWTFVWEALLQHKTGLPGECNEKRLLALGCDWLKGREDKKQWTFVWEALLDNEAHWAGTLRLEDVVRMGETWLSQHPQSPSTPVVMSRLLLLLKHVRFEARNQLDEKMVDWAAQCAHFAPGAAGRIFEAMADRGFARVPEISNCAVEWCESNQTLPTWFVVAFKFLCYAEPSERWDVLASTLNQHVRKHPNYGGKLLLSAHNEMSQAAFRRPKSQAFDQLCKTFANRFQATQWREAQNWQDLGDVLSAVICPGPKSAKMCELPNGLFATLQGTKKDHVSLRLGDCCKVVLNDVIPEEGLIHASLAPEPAKP